MAENLGTDVRPSRRRYYPWDKWANGDTWRAKAGEDFSVSVTSFQTVLHQRARHLGIDVETGSPEKGIVEFRFFKPEEAALPGKVEPRWTEVDGEGGIVLDEH